MDSFGQMIGDTGRRIVEHDYRPDISRAKRGLDTGGQALDDLLSAFIPTPEGGIRAAQQGGEGMRSIIDDIVSGYQRKPGLTGSAAAGPPAALPNEVRPEDLAGEDAFMRQFHQPAGAVAAPAPPPKAAPPGPTRGPALNSRAGMPSGVGMGDVHTAEAADTRAAATSSRNQSAQDIRSKLGFSWGKGVPTHDVDGVSRPIENDVMTLTAPDFTPGVSGAASTRAISRIEGDAGPEVLQQLHLPSGARRELTHNAERGGGYAMGENADSVLDQIARETAARQLERTQVGSSPAPETRGEMLEDKRKTQRVTELAADRDAKLQQAQAMLAHGDYTPEEYAAARDQVVREFSMLSGVDPRWSQVR